MRDIATTTTGKVRVSRCCFEPGDDPALARTIRQAVEKVEGVTRVQVNVIEPAHVGSAGRNAHGAGRALPVMDQAPAAPARAPRRRR